MLTRRSKPFSWTYRPLSGRCGTLAAASSRCWNGHDDCGLRIADCGLECSDRRCRAVEPSLMPHKPRIRNPQSAIHNREGLVASLFALPHLVLFVVFLLVPVLYGFYISLHRWHILAKTHPLVG